jgi:hypothetical protein
VDQNSKIVDGEYVIMDAETFITLQQGLRWNSQIPNHGHLCQVLNLEIVVMPTDGLPMIKVVRSPWVEALMTTPRRFDRETVLNNASASLNNSGLGHVHRIGPDGLGYREVPIIYGDIP